MAEDNTSQINTCWYVGAVWSTGDMTDKFMSEGYWENHSDENFTDLVNQIQIGDKIAIKSSYTQKNNLPFDVKGGSVSVMAIKCIGTVTKNYQNGKRVDVEWKKDYKQKIWYFFTYRTTISKIERKPDDWMYGALLDFTFDENAVQDYNAFLSHSYWANKYKLKKNTEDEKYLELIEKYKIIFNKNKKAAFDNEVYKWELLTLNKGKKDLDLINAVRISNNLIYPSDSSTLKTLIEKASNELIQIVNNVIDETKDLIQRLAEFKRDMKSLVQKNLNSKNYAEDERTAALYLTYLYPEKYTFYTYEIYVAYCKYLGFETRKSGEIYPHYCELLHKLESFVSKDDELLEMIANNSSNYYQSNLLLAQNIVYVMLKEDFISLINGEDNMSTKSEKLIEYTELLRNKLNVILQGAPGTGKTYTTASLALSICGVDDIDYSNRDAVMEKYKQLREEGRIGFCTFHQSMDYEDFIEGLRPYATDKGIVYKPEAGIFKIMCERASKNRGNDIIKAIDDYIESIEGFENKKEIPTKSGRSSLLVWHNKGNDTVFTRSTLSEYSRGPEYSPSPLNIEKIKLQALGEGVENNWEHYAEAFINAVKKEYNLETTSSSDEPYVLIIDEINRGYVSKIFGELITLLETDKRLGNPQTELTVELPYSKETNFGIPKNLYIIGTMNTTDRSTGTLDYAVRRRFAFVTLEADETVLIKNNCCDEALALFKDVKEFIENNKLEDIDIGDLMVGHSYFMTNDTNVLKQKIQYEVIPLVKEYIKDGILTCLTSEAKEYFDDWLKLKVHNTQESDE